MLEIILLFRTHLLLISDFFRKCVEIRLSFFVTVRVWGRGEGCTWFWWGNLRERDHWRDLDADGRIILRWIFRKWDGVVGTGWCWLRIGAGGGHL